MRIAGHEVVAMSDRALAIGAKVTLAVRPEKIGFRSDGILNPDARLNALSAVVRDVTFAGEMHRYALEIAPGVALIAKQQHRFHVRAYAPRERVTAEWHVEDTRVV